MAEKVKVLYFVDRLKHGGIQQLLIEMLKHINKDKIQMDVLVFDDGQTYPLEEEVKKHGANLYKIDGWIKTPLSYINQKKALDKFFEEHNDYKVIHFNSSSKNFSILKEAKKYGVPIRITHAHSIDFQTKNQLKIKIGNILKKQLIKNATNYFACSKLAGEWLFGKEIIKTNAFKIIHNAVDYNKFKFNEEIRNKIRNELQIDNNCILFGNAGRIVTLKNHTFLIDVFEKIHQKNKNTKLIIIGTGEKEEEIKQKVNNLNLSNDVIFTGFKNNVNDYFSAIDAFLMPSLYEGLPVTCVEAQASGIPCFLSDAITTEVKIADNVKFISLEKTSEEWAKEILKSDLQRKNNEIQLKEAGYFIENMLEELEKIYLGEK